MYEDLQSPFFWAVISLIGLLGASTVVNTRFGKKYSIFGVISGLLFTLGRIIMVLPLIVQPRFSQSLLLFYTGIVLGILSLIFIIPSFKSQALIFPSKSPKLNTNGLYSIVRHPYYLGEILFSLALSLIFRSIIGLAFTPIWWVALQLHILHEEESLEREFGPFYLEYKKRVKGRIIPIQPIVNSPIPSYPFKNLVFRGGGMKGTAYTGALEVLSERGLLKQIQRVAGSSVGAITAALVSFNLDFPETLELIESLDFKQVPQLSSDPGETESEWRSKFLGKEISKISRDIEAIQRLMTKYGWYSSEYFNHWIRDVISHYCNGNPDATFQDFKDLGYKDLYIISANISKLEVSIFSQETTPDFPVAAAIRMSISIPLYFEVLRYNGKDIGEGDYYVDGGVLLNYPLHLFDHPRFKNGNIWFKDGINWETLGFYLYTNAEMVSESKKIENFKDFISHLYESYNLSLQLAEIEHNPIDRRRSVKINTLGVSSTDFQLTKNDRKYQDLVDEGRKATQNYLENYHQFIINK